MIAVCSVLVAVACFAAPAQTYVSEFLRAAVPDADITLDSGRIRYRGLITEQGYAKLVELYEVAQSKPSILQIESRGGRSRAAIALGNWIFERGLDVEVATYCLSSCATYVFTAGTHKRLAPHASLVWHGGATQPVTSDELERVLDDALQSLDPREREAQLAKHSRAERLRLLEASLQELRTLETQLFEKLGVDQRITTLGLSQTPIPAPGGPRYCGWDYSLEDLELLGVRNIEVAGDIPWAPQFPFSETAVYRVSLRDLTGFQPAASHLPASRTR